MTSALSVAVAVLAVILMWAVVVGVFWLFMLAMIWITSHGLPLTGRRRRK